MMDITKLAGIFYKRAIGVPSTGNHYTQITNVYNASKEILRAVNDADLKPSATQIANSAARLLWNADNYGITAQTSTKYRDAIQSGLNDLMMRLPVDTSGLAREPSQKQRIESASNKLQFALNDYNPESISAVRPKTQQPAQVINLPEETIQGQVPQAAPMAINFPEETIHGKVHDFGTAYTRRQMSGLSQTVPGPVAAPGASSRVSPGATTRSGEGAGVEQSRGGAREENQADDMAVRAFMRITELKKLK